MPSLGSYCTLGRRKALIWNWFQGPSFQRKREKSVRKTNDQQGTGEWARWLFKVYILNRFRFAAKLRYRYLSPASPQNSLTYNQHLTPGFFTVEGSGWTLLESLVPTKVHSWCWAFYRFRQINFFGRYGVRVCVYGSDICIKTSMRSQ